MCNALSLSFSSQKTVLTLHSYRWYTSRRLDSISDPFFFEISILTRRVCQGNIFQKTQSEIIFLKPEEVTVCVGEITNKSFYLLWLYRSLLINAETCLWLNQVISPEHMKKLGFLQLRWKYWSSGQYSQIDSFLVPLTWSILDTCFRETWNTVPKPLQPAEQWEGPDTMNSSNQAVHSVRQILRRSWLRVHLLASASLQWSLQRRKPFPQPLLSKWFEGITVCIQFPSCIRMPM